MTTTITVKARAHGAKVSLTNASGPQSFDIPGNTERTFHIDASHSLTVEQGEAPVEQPLNPTPFEGEAVPGAAENDQLLTSRDIEDFTQARLDEKPKPVDWEE